MKSVQVFEKKKGGATGLVVLKDLRWGTQQGLPFALSPDGLPSCWEVALPAEDGGLWMQGVLHPAAWATTIAEEMRCVAKIEDSDLVPSPAPFGLLLKNDASVVGEHVR